MRMSPVMTAIMERWPTPDERQSGGTIAGTSVLSGTASLLKAEGGTAAGTSTLSGTATADASLRREITDTITHVQKPVDVVLAGTQDEKKNRLKQPGVMTKSMMKKIFGE